MKYLLTIATILTLFCSCNDTKKQEKDLLNQVIATHDSVMAKDEHLVKSRMQLDTLLKTKPDSAGTKLVGMLNAADTTMENWMHNFDAENKGKSHEEIMTYLEDQKQKIHTIDQQFDTVIKAANIYLSSAKTK